jgi:tetratricopeptide (TPR) repeat protein
MAGHLADVMDEHCLVDEALAVDLLLWDSDDQHLRDVADVYYSPVLWDLRRISSDGRDVLVAHMRSRADAELSSTNPRRAGRAYYNLAQTLNALGRTAEAVDCLGVALAYDPGYANRDYFFRERGGFQWSLDRYAAAADDYQSALHVGADPSEVTPLLADALLYAGRYERALSVLAGWSPTGHDLDRLAALDILAVGELIRVTDVVEQNRRAATTEEIAAADDDTTMLIELLRGTDALDPRIWIQLIGDSPTLSRTVLVALVSLNSGLAWAIATATAVEHTDAVQASLDTVHHIVDSAVRLTRDGEYTEAIEQVLVDADREFANRVRTIVYERMQALRDRPPPHTTRVIVDLPDMVDGPQGNAGP